MRLSSDFICRALNAFTLVLLVACGGESPSSPPAPAIEPILVEVVSDPGAIYYLVSHDQDGAHREVTTVTNGDRRTIAVPARAMVTLLDPLRRHGQTIAGIRPGDHLRVGRCELCREFESCVFSIHVRGPLGFVADEIRVYFPSGPPNSIRLLGGESVDDTLAVWLAEPCTSGRVDVLFEALDASSHVAFAQLLDVPIGEGEPMEVHLADLPWTHAVATAEFDFPDKLPGFTAFDRQTWLMSADASGLRTSMLVELFQDTDTDFSIHLPLGFAEAFRVNVQYAAESDGSSLYLSYTIPIPTEAGTMHRPVSRPCMEVRAIKYDARVPTRPFLEWSLGGSTIAPDGVYFSLAWSDDSATPIAGHSWKLAGPPSALPSVLLWPSLPDSLSHFAPPLPTEENKLRARVSASEWSFWSSERLPYSWFELDGTVEEPTFDHEYTSVSVSATFAITR